MQVKFECSSFSNVEGHRANVCPSTLENFISGQRTESLAAANPTACYKKADQHVSQVHLGQRVPFDVGKRAALKFNLHDSFQLRKS